MYKSSGEYSGMPNTWLPFDEMFEQDHLMFKRDWWNKQSYTAGNQEVGFDRFGTEELHSISQRLTAADLSTENPFVLRSAFHVNTILDFFGARITGNNQFRPTGDKPKVFGP